MRTPLTRWLAAVIALVGARHAQADDVLVPALVISDPRVLEAWDADARSPLSLVRVLRHIEEEQKLPARAPSDAAGASTGERLAAFKSTYGKIADVLAADEARVIEEIGLDWEKDITKTYVTDAAKTAIGKDRFHRGNGNVTRFFEEGWLRSPEGQFVLAGVVFRPDRRDFDPGTCGELRFLYRLAYEVERGGKTYASRMPFMMNVVWRVPDDGAGCRSVATQLLTAPIDLAKLHFKQIELNAQLARFPSDLENVDGRKFAGQALYWMRIFAFQNGAFAPTPLENTPDVQAIRADPAKRRALADFIGNNVDAIDTGVFRIPDVLLADVALTWSTLGSARTANRPFDALFSVADADAIVATHPPRAHRFIAGGASLLERLNTSTCMGCHQSSSTAGFHFLGVDRDFGKNPAAVRAATDGNRLELPFSPHFAMDLARRGAYAAQLAHGAAPEMMRPHPSSPPAHGSADGAHFDAASVDMPCPLGDGDKLGPSSSWWCAAGLTCRALASNAAQSFTLGRCVPAATSVRAGLACRADVVDGKRAHAASGATKDAIAFNVDAWKDRVAKEDALFGIGEGALNDRDYNCRPTRIGVPLGRVTRQCRSTERALDEVSAASSEVCAIVGGKGFEEMAKGMFDSARFGAAVGRGLLDTCSPQRFCREDYICQELPDFLVDNGGVKKTALDRVHAEHVGFCTPTYFVYQMRLDGHPNPKPAP